jgi:hypothetical protein
LELGHGGHGNGDRGSSAEEGEKGKRRARLRQCRGGAPLLDGQQAARWDSHGAWRTCGGRALKPVGTVAAERILVFQFIRATDG